MNKNVLIKNETGISYTFLSVMYYTFLFQHFQILKNVKVILIFWVVPNQGVGWVWFIAHRLLTLVLVKLISHSDLN